MRYPGFGLKPGRGGQSCGNGFTPWIGASISGLGRGGRVQPRLQRPLINRLDNRNRHDGLRIHRGVGLGNVFLLPRRPNGLVPERLLVGIG